MLVRHFKLARIAMELYNVVKFAEDIVRYFTVHQYR